MLGIPGMQRDSADGTRRGELIRLTLLTLLTSLSIGSIGSMRSAQAPAAARPGELQK